MDRTTRRHPNLLMSPSEFWAEYTEKLEEAMAAQNESNIKLYTKALIRLRERFGNAVHNN